MAQVQSTVPSDLADKQHFFETHASSFAVSSDRVRLFLFISLSASIVTLTAYRNVFDNAWMRSRSSVAREATQLLDQVLPDPKIPLDSGASSTLGWTPENLRNCLGRERLASPPPSEETLARKEWQYATIRKCAGKLESQNAALLWIERNRHSRASFLAHLDHLEELRVHEMQVVRIPVLGVAFDINDLGFFSSLSQAFLSMFLFFAMYRYHENLYLCLQIVKRISAEELRFNSALSLSNYFYHTLAMRQMFSKPPTLARWHRSLLRRLAIALFFVPSIVQAYVLNQDLRTFDVGSLFSWFPS